MINRKGVIKISYHFIDNEPDRVQEVFSKVLPLEIKTNHFNRIIEYYCISKEFEEVEENCAAPFYEVVFTEKDGKYIITFEKV